MYRFSCDWQDQFSSDHCGWTWFDTAQVDEATAAQVLAAATRAHGGRVPGAEAVAALGIGVGERVVLFHPDIDFEVEAALRFGPLLAHGSEGAVERGPGWFFTPDWSTVRDCPYGGR